MNNCHIFENNQYIYLFYEWKKQYNEKTFKSKVNGLIKMFHPDYNPNCEKSHNETQLILQANQMINDTETFSEIASFKEITNIKNIENLETELQEEAKSREQTAKFAFATFITALFLGNTSSNTQKRKRYSNRRRKRRRRY